MAITKKYRLVFSDLSKNSYKYWDGELHEDGRVISRYGVVGATNPQEKDYGCVGESFLEKKVKEKCRKGYEHAKVVLDTPNIPTQDVSRGSLADIALSQIKFSNAVTQKLIRRLVDSNVHKITSATNITFNQSSGLFQTPLGVVTAEGITEARNMLAFFNQHRTIDSLYQQRINQYLKIIPRNKGHRMTYEQVFPDLETIQKESDLLDALESSLKVASTPASAPDGTAAKPVEQVFNLKLDRLDDDKERDRITKWYESTKKSMHHYDRVKIVDIYAIDIVDYNANYDKKLGNDVEVWHGSSEANILSILKSGIKVAPPATAQIAGKLFGNGAYGSKTSSKSLGYTFSRWGQSSGNSGWMFVCDFAMGRIFEPTTYGLSRLPSGYDSCFANPAKTKLHNDEYIVYKESQVRMKYLLEVK